MSLSIRKHGRLAALAAICALLGAGASVIASAGAATGTTAAAKSKPAARAMSIRRLARRAVHGDLVVYTRSGFRTVTFDRGIVQSVNGQQLTLTEGIKTAPYKTVTLTIPSNARIRDNGHKATLADVKTGQRALVLQGLKRTAVVARDARGG